VVLTGKRIAITRAAEQAGELAAKLAACGAKPIICPMIAIVPPDDLAPLDRALDQIHTYDWLLVTSANGVAALFARMDRLQMPTSALSHLALGAVGPATARALADRGLPARFVPHAQTAEGILAEIGDVAGRRFLLPQGDIARPTLATGLRERGALVDEIVVYRTVPGSGAGDLRALLRARGVDAVAFTSPSTARYLLDGMAAGSGVAEAVALLSGIKIVCIGPVTAAAVADLGLRVDAVAASHSGDGLVAALVSLFRST
jgi:uroporphyrinogen-III synthase